MVLSRIADARSGPSCIGRRGRRVVRVEGRSTSGRCLRAGRHRPAGPAETAGADPAGAARRLRIDGAAGRAGSLPRWRRRTERSPGGGRRSRARTDRTGGVGRRAVRYRLDQLRAGSGAAARTTPARRRRSSRRALCRANTSRSACDRPFRLWSGGSAVLVDLAVQGSSSAYWVTRNAASAGPTMPRYRSPAAARSSIAVAAAGEPGRRGRAQLCAGRAG